MQLEGTSGSRDAHPLFPLLRHLLDRRKARLHRDPRPLTRLLTVSAQACERLRCRFGRHDLLHQPCMPLQHPLHHITQVPKQGETVSHLRGVGSAEASSLGRFTAAIPADQGDAGVGSTPRREAAALAVREEVHDVVPFEIDEDAAVGAPGRGRRKAKSSMLSTRGVGWAGSAWVRIYLREQGVATQ